MVSEGNLSAYDHSQIIILGDGEAGKSLAMLLGYCGDRCVRILATRELIWVDRL